VRSLLALVLAPTLLLAQRAQEPFPQSDTLKLFELRSELLSACWGRPMTMQAAVVLPEDVRPDEKLPVCYSIHGFGGSHRSAERHAPRLVEGMRAGTTPRMLFVFLNAQFSLGHHEFADSVNNGPWGRALTEELVPALEAAFPAAGTPAGRLLTGHSSGGWSSLWLQVTYLDTFGGTWSTAPDSVDFRDFTGIDIYTFDNAYRDPSGEPIQLVRRRGEWVMTIEQFVRRELSRRSHGGQFMSFNAVFSPRGEDGRPMNLFDPETGAIDRFVAESWRKYDIGAILRERWPRLRDKLAGKLHVWIGTEDTFRLEGAVRLLRDDLARLGSDADILLVEGRDHGSLSAPHPELWPDGMLARIHREMRASFDKASAVVSR